LPVCIILFIFIFQYIIKPIHRCKHMIQIVTAFLLEVILCTVMTLLFSSMSTNFNPLYFFVRHASKIKLPLGPIFSSSHLSCHNLRILTSFSVCSAYRDSLISLQNGSIFIEAKSSSSHNLPAAASLVIRACA